MYLFIYSTKNYMSVFPINFRNYVTLNTIIDTLDGRVFIACCQCNYVLRLGLKLCMICLIKTDFRLTTSRHFSHVVILGFTIFYLRLQLKKQQKVLAKYLQIRQNTEVCHINRWYLIFINM